MTGDPKPDKTVCAIYTRVSTDERLDQEFNSLDAQREAAEAYIASQRAEGWTLRAERYDDGGFSGGSMERPALQRLLADERMEVAMVRHANAARDEVKHLADEFLALARTTSVPTPTINRLYPHLDPDSPLMPDGSAKIPLDWRGVWIGLGALAGVLAGLIFVLRTLRGKRR